MSQKDDRILPLTRIVAALVVPFLSLAFLILYFYPQLSGEHFAWAINPPMTAMFMGAGYIGGAWLFVNAVFGQRWHKIAAGFPAVTTFASTMLLTTILHWDKFDIRHFPFLLWLILYIVTPFLIPFVWLRNRGADSGEVEADEVLVPQIARKSLLLLGVLILGFAITGFLRPAWLIGVWQWTLSPLTARVMSGWFALLGVGGIVISGDTRWSAWRVGIESIGIWQILVLIAAFINAGQFHNGLWNWYTISVGLTVTGMILLYVHMGNTKKEAQSKAVI